jgi:diacylglycerol kinase
LEKIKAETIILLIVLIERIIIQSHKIGSNSVNGLPPNILLEYFMKKFCMGFVYAFRGMIDGFEGRNMRVHGIATLIVLFMSWYYRLSVNEWIIILILIALIWSAELINSSVEELNNIVRDTNKLSYEATTKSRDLASGSVLIIAIIAAIIALIIFVPKMLV